MSFVFAAGGGVAAAVPRISGNITQSPAGAPCPPQLSVEAISSFPPQLPPLDDSRMAPAVASSAAALRAKFTTASSNAQALMLSMRECWEEWNLLPILPSAAVALSDPQLATGPRSNSTGSASANPTPKIEVMRAQVDALKEELHDLGTRLVAATVSSPALSVSLSAGVSSHACVQAGMLRRDHNFLQQVFDKYQDSAQKPPRISLSRLPAAMADVFAGAAVSGSNVPTAAPFAVLEAATLGGNRGLDFVEFAAAARAQSQFGRYVDKLPLACIVTDALGAHVGFGDDTLQRFSQLPESALDSAMQAATCGLKVELVRAQAEVCRLLAAQQKSMDQLASSKFQNPRKMACGDISNFHEGLTGRIGSPSLDFLPAMRAEHCVKGGHSYEFTTSNYKIKTSPEREWLQIVGDENGVRAPVPAEDMKHGRVITDISELMKRPLAVKSGLQQCEVIALSLYTGPLFEIYNCLLRRFPLDKYDAFSGQGNTFSTTIFVLVSAIQKLSRRMYLPPSMRLYRGFSSMEMPESFSKVDEETGCSGFAEWGFISTTANKSVAIQYSGVDDGQPRATVLCIRPSSVDRGASIADFSQYPGEEEYLWPPCSFLQLENSGIEVELQPGGGIVSVMSVRVNSNLRTETVEQLVEKKKAMHLTSARLLADEVKGELELLAASIETQERKRRDTFANQSDALQKFSAKINEECSAILERHRGTSAADYVNDNTFRGLVSEILNMKSWAKEKWQLWLKDESKYIFFVKDSSLLDCHRMWLTYLRKRIRESEPNSIERRRACLELLQSKGLVKAAARGELNAEGEDLIVAAGSDGWNADDLNALLTAGADVATADKNGKTGLWSAASCGHASALKVLLAAGADANACSNCSEFNTNLKHAGASALWIAAWNGHTDCVAELIASHKVDVHQCNKNGRSPLYAASYGGHLSCIQTLILAKADVLQCDKEGWAPIHRAAYGGHTSCIQVLVTGGADVNVKEEHGHTPLHLSANGGHTEVSKLLVESKADLAAVNGDGRTPLHSCAAEGHAEVAKLLVKCKADLAAVDGNGRTPLHFSACFGHTEFAKLLVECKADLAAVDGNGRTPLHFSAYFGRTEVAKLLVECKADLTAVDSVEQTPLHLSADAGHAEVAKLLVELKADLAAVDGNGSTPLHFSAGGGHTEVAKLLVECKADVAVVNGNGWTPLQLSAISGHVEVSKLLVKCKADLAAVDENGRTPLHLSAIGGHVEVAKLLVECKADMAAVDENGSTSLHLSADGGHVEVAKLLVYSKSDVTARTSLGHTPLKMAVDENKSDVAVFLRSFDAPE